MPGDLSQLAPWLPPAAAVVVAVGYMALQYLKRGDDQDRDEWDRMRQLLDEFKADVVAWRRRAELAEAERDRYRARYGPLEEEMP